MEVQGKVKHVGQTETVGNNGFQKRLIAIETEEQYPQILGVEFVQDKTSLLDAFNTGDTVKIGINLRGREWTNPQGEVKYFNSIQGWRIDKVGAATETAAAPATTNESVSDDLPF